MEAKQPASAPSDRPTALLAAGTVRLRSNFVAARLDQTKNRLQQDGNLGNVGLSEVTPAFCLGLALAGKAIFCDEAFSGVSTVVRLRAASCFATAAISD